MNPKVTAVMYCFTRRGGAFTVVLRACRQFESSDVAKLDLTEAIDVDSIPDTQDASASQKAAQSSGQASSMYAVWDVARTDELRSKTHRGAWCNPCLKHGVKKGPKGHFLAQIDAILTHAKDCPRRSAAIKQSAAAELRIIRDKKKKGPLAGVK
ncbi:TPA: hypothetical protein ACH3X1_009241 [Trebouxia sp. C0004]